MSQAIVVCLTVASRCFAKANAVAELACLVANASLDIEARKGLLWSSCLLRMRKPLEFGTMGFQASFARRYGPKQHLQ